MEFSNETIEQITEKLNRLPFTHFDYEEHALCSDKWKVKFVMDINTFTHVQDGYERIEIALNVYNEKRRVWSYKFENTEERNAIAMWFIHKENEVKNVEFKASDLKNNRLQSEWNSI